MFGIDDLAWIALGSLAVQGVQAGVNWYYNNKANKRSEKQLDIQNDQLGLQEKQYGLQEQSINLQEQSLNESLRSNYYSYMQQLNSMTGELGQNKLAVNQQYENIASNQNYLDRWASEYDMSMQSNINDVYNQYQQLASNYASGLVTNAETGRRGGSAGRLAADAGMSLAAVNGGSTRGFSLQGSRLGSFLQSTAMDMLSDRQTAISAVDTSYKAIVSYQDAMNTLQKNIGSMEDTTKQIKDKLTEKGLEV